MSIYLLQQSRKGSEAASLDMILSRNPEAIVGTLRPPDGSYSTSDEDALAYQMETHFPSFNNIGNEEVSATLT